MIRVFFGIASGYQRGVDLDQAQSLRGLLATVAHARAKQPERWPKKIRNWSPEGAVTLNPEKVGQKEAS